MDSDTLVLRNVDHLLAQPMFTGACGATEGAPMGALARCVRERQRWQAHGWGSVRACDRQPRQLQLRV